ncbi:MAG: aminotransferase class III-fold pyridoxal phosphate-dependent enzyme [Gemmatimonadota bacterium]
MTPGGSDIARDLIPGFTSTGSKRPDALFGPGADADLPTRMIRSAGCRVWDTEGREYLDFISALGAVALGYGHPAVIRAAIEAVASGAVGPLAPSDEMELASELQSAVPWLESIRFLKTGAEAVAASVRIARAATGRERVLGCGYHGWLDWCQLTDPAVPAGTRASLGALRFDDPDDVRRQCQRLGDTLAAIVVEPVIEKAPSREWLDTLRAESARVGAVLIFDEIKTGFRLAVGGAAERYGVRPDLVVFGKALASGFPLALVGGRRDIMARISQTWISSTLATEMVSLAAARATLRVMIEEQVPATLHRRGTEFMAGLVALATRYPSLIESVRGLPEMCHLVYREEAVGADVARAAARRGLLFKRTAYNFVSLAHQPADITRAMDIMDEVLSGIP